MSKSLNSVIEDIVGALNLGNANRFVGIDIGMSGVKVCELIKQGKNNYFIKNFGYAPLAEGSIIEDQFHKKDQVLESIKMALERAGIKNKTTCFGLSPQNTVIKKMKAPFGTKQEIEDHISWEAEQFIPYGAENSTLSIHIPEVKSSDKKNPDGQDVIMTAAKLETVEEYEAVLAAAGLKVKIIDLQILAIINLMEYSYEEELEELKKGTLLLDLGAQTTKIIIYKDGMPLFTKSLPIGGVNVTEEIQKNIGLSFDEAEDLKLLRDENGNVPEEVAAIIKEMVDKIVIQIKENINFYIAASAQDKVFRCLATGGNLQLPGLIEAIAASSGLTIELIDPTKKMKVTNKKITEEIVEQISYVGGVAIGLALRGLMK